VRVASNKQKAQALREMNKTQAMWEAKKSASVAGKKEKRKRADRTRLPIFGG
jgi:hypothetical protein